MQTKKHHDECRTTKPPTPSTQPQLTNPPRRMVWADIGGKPQGNIAAATQNRTTAIQAARHVCIAAYASAYRKQRKAAILAQRDNPSQTSATHTTDGILGTVTAVKPKQRRFVIPDARRGSTHLEMQNLFLYNARQTWDELCAQNTDVLPQPNNRADEPNGRAAQPADPLSDEEDIFGHGGSLD